VRVGRLVHPLVRWLVHPLVHVRELRAGSRIRNGDDISL
jgi:hypothetical protein